MKRLLILIAIVLLSPFILQAGAGLYLGYNVYNGVVNLVPVMAGRNLVPEQPVIHPEAAPDAVPRVVTWQGELDNEQLVEASGIAASGFQKDVFFSVNDSGNAPRLFAVGRRGENLGSWPLKYDGLHDFEDIASFRHKGQHYILVADTGDNFNWRSDLKLIVFPEPDVAGTDQNVPLSPAWTIRYQYPDGYRDCEAVDIDESSGEIFLISKRRIPAELFSLPLETDGEPVTARAITRLTGLPQPTLRDLREDSKWGAHRSNPTAMDIEGRTAVVVTYRDAYLYRRGLTQNWAEAFSGEPERVALPYIHGLEAGTLTPGGKRLVLVGEREDGVQRMGVYEVKL